MRPPKICKVIILLISVFSLLFFTSITFGQTGSDIEGPLKSPLTEEFDKKALEKLQKMSPQEVEKLDKMLPEIKIDPEPLYEEAKDIEKKIRAFMEQSKPTAPSVQPAPFNMYR